MIWSALAAAPRGTGLELLKAREVAAVTASARWVLAAANMRKESRGIHRRSDFPLEDGSQAGRIIVSGLDRVSAVRETELLDDVSEGAI